MKDRKETSLPSLILTSARACMKRDLEILIVSKMTKR